MMAFAINKATEFINPTKALEYLATGKPVISTPVRDVVRQYSDTVELAATAQEFVDKVEHMLHHPDQKKIADGLTLARKMSWEGHVASMRKNIKDAIEAGSSRSRNVTPLPDLEPGYLFKTTLGS